MVMMMMTTTIDDKRMENSTIFKPDTTTCLRLSVSLSDQMLYNMKLCICFRDGKYHNIFSNIQENVHSLENRLCHLFVWVVVFVFGQTSKSKQMSNCVCRGHRKCEGHKRPNEKITSRLNQVIETIIFKCLWLVLCMMQPKSFKTEFKPRKPISFRVVAQQAT